MGSVLVNVRRLLHHLLSIASVLSDSVSAEMLLCTTSQHPLHVHPSVIVVHLSKN